jgi:hypothetical protein
MNLMVKVDLTPIDTGFLVLSSIEGNANKTMRESSF